jgi:hypothetical protein
MSAFPLRIPIHGVALFESDFMIALGKRQGDIARPLRLDIVEVFAVVIDFVERSRAKPSTQCVSVMSLST